MCRLPVKAVGWWLIDLDSVEEEEGGLYVEGLCEGMRNDVVWWSSVRPHHFCRAPSRNEGNPYCPVPSGPSLADNVRSMYGKLMN